MERFGPFFSFLCCANTTCQRQYEYLILTSLDIYPVFINFYLNR